MKRNCPICKTVMLVINHMDRVYQCATCRINMAVASEVPPTLSVGRQFVGPLPEDTIVVDMARTS